MRFFCGMRLHKGSFAMRLIRVCPNRKSRSHSVIAKIRGVIAAMALSTAVMASDSADAVKAAPDATGDAIAPASGACEATLASRRKREAPSEEVDIGGVSELKGTELQDFGVQYWGDSFQPSALAAATHSALIIEPALVGADVSPRCREERFSAAEIGAIRRNGARRVFGYLNIGELASYRDYWVEAFGGRCTQLRKPSLSSEIERREGVCLDLPNWYGARTSTLEVLAAFWTKEWETVLRHRIDSMLQMGFDGAFLDDVLHYFSWGSEEALIREASARVGPTTMAESAQGMMALVVRLSRYARSQAPHARPSFKMIVNGAPYILWDASEDPAKCQLCRDYVDAMDAILVENALSREKGDVVIEMLRDEYLRCGTPVLTIEIWSPQNAGVSFEQFRLDMREKAKSLGFITYVAADGLFDRLYPPISQPLPANGKVNPESQKAP